MIINEMTLKDKDDEFKKKSYFFQIKFLDLDKENESDEVMIIILDIS